MSIYHYMNLSEYLGEAMNELRQSSGKSYRALAKEASLGAPNFIQQVIQGKRKMNFTHLQSIARLLKLSDEETDYFRLLADFNYCQDNQEKELLLNKIRSIHRKMDIEVLESHQYDFFRYWYYPAIWELACHPNCQGIEWIAQNISPRVTQTKVKKALHSLKKMGLIMESPTGWKRKSDSIQTAAQTTGIALRFYHQEVLDLAKDSMHRYGRNERSVRSNMIGLSQRKIDILHQRLEAMWQELVEFDDEDEEIDKIYQVSMQAFPISKKLT